MSAVGCVDAVEVLHQFAKCDVENLNIEKQQLDRYGTALFVVYLFSAKRITYKIVVIGWTQPLLSVNNSYAKDNAPIFSNTNA